MADKLEVIKWDDPRLSTVCDKVDQTEFGDKLHEFGEQLIATMRVENGVGLAAPQVGILKRIFVMDFPEHAEWKPIVVCNPTISPYGEVVGHEEGCLSIPGVKVWIERPKQTILKYQEPKDGRWNEIDLADVEAFCAQHEWDHCEGVMMFDRKRVTRQQHRQALREWDKIHRK